MLFNDKKASRISIPCNVIFRCYIRCDFTLATSSETVFCNSSRCCLSAASKSVRYFSDMLLNVVFSCTFSDFNSLPFALRSKIWADGPGGSNKIHKMIHQLTLSQNSIKFVVFHNCGWHICGEYILNLAKNTLKLVNIH